MKTRLAARGFIKPVTWRVITATAPSNALAAMIFKSSCAAIASTSAKSNPSCAVSRTCAKRSCCLREDEPGHKRLVAYLQRSAHPSPDAGMLQQFLKAKLPDYMTPSAFVVLDKFPLTPNGKINRKALPPPVAERPESKHGFTPPRTPTEEMLAKIWRELLGQSVIGIDDNFFETGGHSLLAMQLMARVRNEFQTELSLRNIFEAPTVAELAIILDRKKNQPAMPGLSPMSRAQNISAQHAQELLDRLDELSDTEVESLLQQISAESGGRL